MRITLACQAVYDGTTGIPHAHYLGTLVHGLACGIVNCLAYDFHIIVCTHQDYLAVASAHQQTQERKRRNGVFIARLTYKMSQHMSLKVIDLYHWYVQAGRQPLGETYTNEQGAHQSGTTCKGYSRKLLTVHSGTFQRLIHHRNDVLLMGAAGQFRYHTAVCLVHSLGGRHVGQQYAILHYRCTGIVAGGFYSKYYHVNVFWVMLISING